MRKRVLLVSVAVAALGLVAVALGFVAERANSKSFGGFDGRYCVYRRTAALGCGVAAGVFLLAGQAVLAAASGCFGRRGDARARFNGRKRSAIVSMFTIFWTVSMGCTMMLLYGAWRNAGSRRVPTRGRYHSMYGCAAVLGGGLFSGASVSSAIAFVFGITAYVYMEKTTDPAEPAASSAEDPGVSMEQPYFQPQAPYPAMGYPAAAAAAPPPPYGRYPAAAPPPPYGGYGAKAPAGGPA